MQASEAQLSSISKNKQKSFKPDLFEVINCLILNTKKYLKLGVVMLMINNKRYFQKAQNLIEWNQDNTYRNKLMYFDQSEAKLVN